jgi:hypothetical protein
MFQVLEVLVKGLGEIFKENQLGARCRMTEIGAQKKHLDSGFRQKYGGD